MSPGERRLKIIDHVRSAERASVDDLAQLLDASRETIRRDLAELDGRGLLRKVHGGAVVVEPASILSVREGPFHTRMSENTAAKRTVARTAAKLFSPGDSLFIDTGTTTLLFAEELSRSSGLTVITNSGAIAALVAKGVDNRVFQIGGEYRRGGQECIGELAVEQIRHFRAAHAVLTVAAVVPAGFLNFDLQEAQIARAMSAQAGGTTILADASKVGRAGIFEVCSLDEADRLVMDRIPDSMAKVLADSRIEVHVADPQAPELS